MEYCILDLNEDCYFALFNCLDWKEILIFGLTNRYVFYKVLDYIQHKRSVIKLNVDIVFDFKPIFKFYAKFMKKLEITNEKSLKNYCEENCDEWEIAIDCGYANYFFWDIIKKNIIEEYSFF